MSTSSALITQSRVIYALLLREIHTLYGDSRLGYLWAVFDAMLVILIFWAIRSMRGFEPPRDMTLIAFLLSGFMVWFTFADTLKKCLVAVQSNNALLTYPQVTPLDIMISRTLLVLATRIISGFILACIANLYNQDVYIYSLGPFFTVLLITPLLGLGLGVFFASLLYYIPILEKVIPICLRIMFFTSGTFFSVSRLPSSIQEYLLWNPVVHLVELFRTAFSSYAFSKMHIDMPYVVFFTLIFLVLGLLLERYMRGRYRI